VLVAKSASKDVEIRHEEPIDILQSAFDKQGDLDRWKSTDFVGTGENNPDIDGSLLQDSGVIRILEKIVSLYADLFVIGSNRCSQR
jgi:hypothetical protein